MILLCVGAEPFSRARFGEGEGPILLDDVICIGNEERLENCPSSGFGVSNCAHGEDAGVRCMSAAPRGNLKNYTNSSVSTEYCIGLHLYTVYLLIYRTAKNNYFGNCPGIIGTDFYTACEVSGIIRTNKQLHAS